jgi:menaquinol-cytochrome c reductase iron-sulfur subunit
MDRKTFLKVLTWGGGMTAAAAVGVPVLSAALSPATHVRKEPKWQPVGRPEDFPIDEVRKAVVAVPRDDWARSLREQAVYVWRPSPREVVVFSRKCTDLSCPVTWDPGSGCFFCPCHGGIFAKNGERMAGPPKRPLYRYPNRLREGVIEIDLNSLS